MLFQHTAARRRLVNIDGDFQVGYGVSTHSRPKAAGRRSHYPVFIDDVSTHSRPKAAGMNQALVQVALQVSTHSRPKAAGHNYQK